MAPFGGRDGPRRAGDVGETGRASASMAPTGRRSWGRHEAGLTVTYGILSPENGHLAQLNAAQDIHACHG